MGRGGAACRERKGRWKGSGRHGPVLSRFVTLRRRRPPGHLRLDLGEEWHMGTLQRCKEHGKPKHPPCGSHSIPLDRASLHASQPSSSPRALNSCLIGIESSPSFPGQHGVNKPHAGQGRASKRFYRYTGSRSQAWREGVKGESPAQVGAGWERRTALCGRLSWGWERLGDAAADSASPEGGDSHNKPFCLGPSSGHLALSHQSSAAHLSLTL